MRHLLLPLLIILLLSMSGCTKQETKSNLHNINEGLKNGWKKTKGAFSDSTEDFKESTK